MSDKVKVKSSFVTDAYLMYLIQQTTNLPTDEILGFFHDFGTQILKLGAEKMKGHSIRKDIRDFYPDTAIPFKMLVTGHKGYYNYNAQTKQHEREEETFSGRIEVCFPDAPSYVDNTQLMNMIMEKALLGGTSMPPFEKPEPRAGKMYKKLVEDVLYKRNHGKNICDT